jgi:hypothetical protein
VGSIVEIADEFLRAFASQESDDLAGPELLPVRLARACTAVLPVDGAGLSAFTPDGFRVPLGASDDVAAIAERLQFTVGEGPCIAAHEHSARVLATETDLAARWPMFHEQLAAHTSFRAIMATPLPDPFDSFGTLDLMLNDPQRLAGLDSADVDAVVIQISQILLRYSLFVDELEPRWARGPAANQRNSVLVACGMVNASLDVNTEDALALLRAHAFATGRTVDEVADDIVHRRISTDELRITT